jgi:hypothetical protein
MSSQQKAQQSEDSQQRLKIIPVAGKITTTVADWSHTAPFIWAKEPPLAVLGGWKDQRQWTQIQAPQ